MACFLVALIFAQGEGLLHLLTKVMISARQVQQHSLGQATAKSCQIYPINHWISNTYFMQPNNLASVRDLFQFSTSSSMQTELHHFWSLSNLGAGEACFQQGLPRKLLHSVSSMSLLGLEQATRHCHKSTQPMCHYHSLYSPYTLRNIDHHYPSLDLCLLIFLPFSPCCFEMDMFNVFNAEPSVVVLPRGSLGAHPETSNVWTSEPASCILSDLHGDWYVIYICVCVYIGNMQFIFQPHV